MVSTARCRNVRPGVILRDACLVFAGLFVAAFVGVAMLASSADAQGPSFTIEVDDVILAAGETEAVVAVRLVPGTSEVGALTIVIDTDPSLMSIVSATSVDTSFPCPVIDGTMRFAGFNQPAWNEPTVLCEVTLASLSTTGSGSMNIEIRVAANSQSELLTGTSTGGAIQIGSAEPTATPTPEPTATPEPSATATPEPSATAVPTPTRAPAIALGPTPTPEPNTTPDATTPDDEESQEAPPDTDPIVEMDPDASDDDASDVTDEVERDDTEGDDTEGDGTESDDDPNSDGANSDGAEDDDGRGSRAPSEAQTPIPQPEASDSEASPDDGADNEGSSGDDTSEDSADPGSSDSAGEIELAGPLVDGSTSAASDGSSSTPLLAAGALTLLAAGGAIGVAARRADRSTDLR